MNLTNREQTILRCLIYSFINNANPIGARALSRRFNLNLSPASIRNTMADLEEKGLLEQPHVSAGRIPTDKGYRIYVNNLMDMHNLAPSEREIIDEGVSEHSGQVEKILQRSAMLLGKLSGILGVVLPPRFDEGKLQKIDLLRLSDDNLMVVVAISSGMVKSIVMEIDTAVKPEELDDITRILNQRLCGLTLKQVRQEIGKRVEELPSESHRSLIRLFVENTHQLFQSSPSENFYLGGMRELLAQPEFSQTDNLHSIIELLEERQVLIHLLNPSRQQTGVYVSIGDENPVSTSNRLSVVTSSYRISGNSGKVGVIGPTRMDYPKLLSLVDYTAKAMHRLFNK